MRLTIALPRTLKHVLNAVCFALTASAADLDFSDPARLPPPPTGAPGLPTRACTRRCLSRASFIGRINWATWFGVSFLTLRPASQVRREANSGYYFAAGRLRTVRADDSAATSASSRSEDTDKRGAGWKARQPLMR